MRIRLRVGRSRRAWVALRLLLRYFLAFRAGQRGLDWATWLISLFYALAGYHNC